MARKSVVIDGEVVPYRSGYRRHALSQERIAAQQSLAHHRAEGNHRSVRNAVSNDDDAAVLAFLSLPFLRRGKRDGTKFGRHPHRG